MNFQSGEFTYYLHESSYQALGLQPTVRGEQPDTLFGFGTVIHKEFCHARRDDNRYGVPQGACFYRVKLKPVNVSKKKKGKHWHLRLGIFFSILTLSSLPKDDHRRAEAADCPLRWPLHRSNHRRPS